MGMGLQNPLDLEVIGAYIGDDFVGSCVASPPGLRVVVQHRINDSARRTAPLMHDVSHGPSTGVKNAVDFGLEHRGRHKKSFNEFFTV